MALFERDRIQNSVAQLLSTDLAWYWLSVTRLHPDEADQSASSGDRALTRLTASNRSAFVADALDRDADGYGRSIVVFGCDLDDEVIAADPAAFRSSLANFADHEVGPIRLVISQVGDSPDEHVFVPHTSTESVQELLRHWGLDQVNTAEVMSYDKLRSARLEALIDRMVTYAFPR